MFHGFEFDVNHVTDCRNVRVDFGPAGTLAFTLRGVEQFVERTQPPWATFPELEAAICAGSSSTRCARLFRNPVW